MRLLATGAILIFFAGCAPSVGQVKIVCPDDFSGLFILERSSHAAASNVSGDTMVIRLSEGGSAQLSDLDFEALHQPHQLTFEDRSGHNIPLVLSIGEAPSDSKWALFEGYAAVGNSQGQAGAGVPGGEEYYYGTVGRSAAAP